jgi:hypothetical protein
MGLFLIANNKEMLEIGAEQKRGINDGWGLA